MQLDDFCVVWHFVKIIIPILLIACHNVDFVCSLNSFYGATSSIFIEQFILQNVPLVEASVALVDFLFQLSTSCFSLTIAVLSSCFVEFIENLLFSQ